MNVETPQAQNDLFKFSSSFTLGGLAIAGWTLCLILGSSGTTKAQEKKCDPRYDPEPIARLLSGSTDIDVTQGIPLKTTLLVVEPKILDADLGDCQYFVTGLILQINNGAPIAIKSGSIPLGPYNLKTGDKLSISQVQVVRSTPDGGTKQVNGSKMSFSIRVK